MNYIMSQRFKPVWEAHIPQAKDVMETLKDSAKVDRAPN